jgi:phytoene dehydrogenase-like protein
MQPDFDLVVVGGGHNGLVCAAYVADRGYRVAVLERYSRIGGAAFTEEFYPGFRNSAASYTVSLLQPKVIADLELAKHGLTIVRRPLDNFIPSAEGPGLKIGGDRAARLARIAAISARDAQRYAGFVDELESVTDFVKPMMLESPIEPRNARDWGRGVAKLAALARGGPARVRSCVSLVRGSAGSWLDRHFESDLLKGGLGFDSVVGHFASPYTPGSAYLLLHHALGEVNGAAGSWGHAIGGMGAISEAIAAAARARGVAIEVDTPVERIEPARGHLEIHAANRVFTARAAAGAIHPQTLFTQLVDAAHLPKDFVARMRSWRSESATLRINVALTELPDFRCLPGTSPGEHHGAGIIFGPSLRYLDDAHASALADGYSAAPVVELLIPSMLDPTLIDAGRAPPGAQVASLFCQHFRRTLPRGAAWGDAKDAAVRRVIETVDAFAPNFSRSIIALKAYSPEDLETRFGLVGGDIFHGAMIPEQLYWSRPARGYAQYRSPVPGLYLCASGAHPGGGVSGAPGHNAARAIIADLARRGSSSANSQRP